MNSQTRDTLALVAIASLAILIVLYADSGLGAIFPPVLRPWHTLAQPLSKPTPRR